MTRGLRSLSVFPASRRTRYPVFLVVATSLIGFGSWGVSNESADAQEVEIQQVVGKQLGDRPRSSGGGLLGGLFGSGRSTSSSGSKSKSKESDRKVTPMPEQRAPSDWSGIPYHSPKGGNTASASTPIRDPGAARPTATPQSTAPRATSQIAGLPTPPALPSSKPQPIAASRAPVALSGPTMNTPTPSTSTREIGSSLESLSDSRSSRRAVAAPTSVAGSPSSKPTLLSSAEPVRSSSEVIELVPKVSRRILKVETPDAAEAVASKPVNAPESSRRVAPPVAATSPATVTPSMPVAKAKPELPKAIETKIATLAPVTTPAPVQPPAPAIVEPSRSVALGEARQSQSSQPESTVRSSTSRSQTAQATMVPPAAAGMQMPSMTTFGNNRPDARATGSLTVPAAGGVALQPISDRLPFDAPQTGEEGTTWHNSENASFDSFAPRTTLAAGPTTPPTNNATFGRATTNGSISSSSRTSGNFPNAMRSDSTRIPAATPAMNVNQNMVVGNNTSTVSSELPGIRIVTAGPRQVMIRQTHTYEVRAENRGSIDAQGLIVRAHIPDWADVVGQQVSAGDVKASTEGSTRQLNWQIERLPAGESQRMFVRLKASRSGTHDLDVDWTLAPQKDVVQIFVQEPQLALTIDGPDEVIYGQSKTYRIRVLNPGDGIAPAVVFTLSPESSTPQSQKIGDIPSGQEAQFEVELTAQDLGELKIHGLATGDLDLKAIANKTVRVLAADLEAILTGPEIKYQNTEGIYQLELANHGTAASDDVMATLNLPIGVRYVGGMEGAVLSDNQLRWKIASLTPGARRDYQFRVTMESTGRQEFAFDCKGSAAGQTSVGLMTTVEAIADLVLSIEDPSAPAPIDQDVRYQIVIRNRGSKPATDVQAIAQFSNGIEPREIQGHSGKVITGQVLIDPIPRIDAGQEVRVTIIARASEGGHHRFRTEIRSGDTILVAEEATHYMNPHNERISNRSGPGGNEFSLPLR